MKANDSGLKEVVDLIPDVLFRCYRGDDGNIYWSLNEGGLAREFHLTTDEIEGKPLQELFAGGASDPVREHFEAAFRGETETFVNEIEGRFFKHYPQPIYRDGKVVEVVGFISEVTELVLAERKLAAANQDLDSFAHSASHDLRLPITVMSNLLQISRTSGKTTSEWHDRMDDAVARMSGIIDSLLAFSRSGSGAIRPETLDVSALAKQSAQMLQEQDKARNIEWDIQPGLTARGDAAMMRIVLDNLLGNAWKYTAGVEDAKIQVVKEGEKILVVDNGIGFAAGEESAIFQPFEQGANALPGHGIGLATVRRIIERHGGTIAAQQAPGGGALFAFELPHK